jgi:hypothetical protein
MIAGIGERKYSIHLRKGSGDHWLIYIFLRLHNPFSMGNGEMTHPRGRGRTRQRKVNGEPEMKHSKGEEWNDGVNHVACDYQLAIEKQRRRRRRGEVGRARLWQKIANVAADEVGYQPAAESVLAAKAAFTSANLMAKPQETPETDDQVQLLFDSFSDPAQAGTRSAATRTRQMLYRADPFQIDLQIEWQPESNSLVVTGQLLDLGHPEIVGRGVPVMLSDGREFIVNTVTNQFGEFRCEVKNSADLELSFLVRSEKSIVILLPGVLDQ